MKQKRENNYELLRIISTIAVISIHVSAFYVKAINDETRFSEGFYLNGTISTCLWNSLSRFAVPCFLMLSGAFTLDNEKNKQYKYFYKKTFKSIGKTTIIFSILYIIFSIILSIMNGNGIRSLVSSAISLIEGEPFYHMWYLFMYFGIILLVPIIIQFKEDIGEKCFTNITVIYLILSSIFGMTSTFELHYDIGNSIHYLGYFMIGYVIRKKSNINSIKGVIYITLGICVELINSYIKYIQLVNNKIPDSIVRFDFCQPLSPLVMISSILIFIGFSKLNIKRDLTKLSSLTFYIFLFHAGIWQLMKDVIIEYGYYWNNRIVIPISILIVLMISLVLSIIYKQILKKIEFKTNFSDKLSEFIFK